MKRRLTLTLVGAALIGLALAGCATSAPSAPSASAPAAGTDATVATTTLGRVVVDGKGMSAYFFDNDKANSGASTCTGQCETIWPAITSKSSTPTVTGITGIVGTITGVAGGKQVTINGRPIYTYAGDKAPGDTNGQGISGIWYVVAPSGDEIKSAAAKSGY